MHRRTFLTAAAAFAAGCARRPNGATPGDPARINAERRDRARHLELLSRFRVPPTATRTTPPPPADVLAVAPELKPLIKVAVRLHPRFSDEPKPDESKLGGQFWWPAGEPWPTCDEHRIPLVTVLQLRAEDAPPNWPFFPGSDLMQLLWCPRDHNSRGWVKPAVVWRKRADVTPPLADPPPTDAAFLHYVPVPCRLFPERVAEFPNWDALPKSVKEKVEAWKPPPLKLRPEWGPPGHAADLVSKPTGVAYYGLAAAADGTKVGGYPLWDGLPAVPTCPTCGWGMDYLLTVASSEWDGANWVRWMPLEERHVRDGRAIAEEGYARAAGLMFGDESNVHLFACRRCDDWPVRLV